MDQQNDLIIKVWAESILHTLAGNKVFEEFEFPYLSISKFAQKREVYSVYYFCSQIVNHAIISVYWKKKNKNSRIWKILKTEKQSP